MTPDDRPWYVIMDPRALFDVDSAMILSADGDMPSLARVRQERDQDWPGCPIVHVETWEVVA